MRSILRFSGMVAVIVATLGQVPKAQAEDKRSDGGPWAKGVMVPSLGLGASFGADLHIVRLALGFRYFVIDGLGVGLRVGDTILVYREALKSAIPGIGSSLPNNIVELLPTLQYVFRRNRRFSSYVIGGIGPVFYNHGGGTVGQWLVGAGALIGLGGPVAINVGIDFTAKFPDSKWKRAFTYGGAPAFGCALVKRPCSFGISPRVGLAFSFGPGRRQRRPPVADPPRTARRPMARASLNPLR